MKELKEISGKNPFKVPEGYFEEVNRKIIASTAGSGSIEREKSLYRKLRPYFAVAASVALLVVLGYTTFQIVSSIKTKPGLTNITINEFTDNYLYDIDILTLEERALSIDPDVASIDIENQDIIDYLVLENIDINDIYEHL